MTNLDGRKEERIMKYIAKSRHEGIAIAEKTFEGYYEIVLNPGWVWDNESTTFFSYDVATLRQDQQRIKFNPESWEGLTGRNYEDAVDLKRIKEYESDLQDGKSETYSHDEVVKEVDAVKYENLYFVYYDSASDTYELEFHTEDGEKEFITIDAEDYPEAYDDEYYFDDKEVVDLIIKESLDARLTNFKGEPVSCVQVIKNDVAELSLNVPDSDVKKVKAACIIAYEPEGYKINVIPLYIG